MSFPDYYRGPTVVCNHVSALADTDLTSVHVDAFEKMVRERKPVICLQIPPLSEGAGLVQVEKALLATHLLRHPGLQDVIKINSKRALAQTAGYLRTLERLSAEDVGFLIGVDFMPSGSTCRRTLHSRGCFCCYCTTLRVFYRSTSVSMVPDLDAPCR